MYDTQMISDLQNRFPQAKAVQLMKDEDFITTLAFNLPYFRAIDKKLRMTAAVYAAQYVKDQADIFGTEVTVIPFAKRINWWLVGGVSAAVFGVWKMFSSTRDSAINVLPGVAAAAVGATPIGAAGTVANQVASLTTTVGEKHSDPEVLTGSDDLLQLLKLAETGA